MRVRARFLPVPAFVTPWIQPTYPTDPPNCRRALGRALLLRSTSPLSPLPPAQYKSFTSSLSAGFSAGEWLRAKPKTESQDAVANPFEAGGMDGAMDGMKKQAVMMCVVFRFLLRCRGSDNIDNMGEKAQELILQGPQHGAHAVHLDVLLGLCPQ